VEIVRVYRIEASHRLPRLPQGHPCAKVHGHSWRIEVRARGPVDPAAGWVQDFADLDAAFAPLARALDHAHLNEVPGLENPTSERVALWVWGRLAPALPLLAQVAVWETEAAGCVYRGEAEPGAAPGPGKEA
jgi:6-pyruvoyltetrahydropterin/6-carboxytetrahydropterin synthase